MKDLSYFDLQLIAIALEFLKDNKDKAEDFFDIEISDHDLNCLSDQIYASVKKEL